MMNVKYEDLPMKVYVESELGMLGKIEKTEMWLVDFDYECSSGTQVAILKADKDVPINKAHTIHMEHVHPIQKERLPLITGGEYRFKLDPELWTA